MYNENRNYLIKEDEISVDDEERRLEDYERRLASAGSYEDQSQYDIDAAAEVLAAVYPDRDPRAVMKKKGLLFHDSDSSESSSNECNNDLSEEPEGDGTSEDTSGSAHEGREAAQMQYEQRRSRWRRVLRTALPLQVGR